jgi:hypothetical protein
MVTIRNISDLDARGLVIENDAVIFCIDGESFTHIVNRKYLNCVQSNNIVFEKLGYLTIEQQQEVASKYYGYPSTPGEWPECAKDDYAALTRLIRGIYQEIDKRPKKVEEPKMKEFKAGMKVRMKEFCTECQKDKIYTLKIVYDQLRAIADEVTMTGCTCQHKWEVVEEVMKMELNEIKKDNLTEAAKQIKAEKTNAEIAYAKQKFTQAQNMVDELDRQIKQAEEAKKPYLEILAKFK